jgi:hypothetical protein
MRPTVDTIPDGPLREREREREREETDVHGKEGDDVLDN